MTAVEFLARVRTRQPLRYTLTQPCRLFAGRVSPNGYGQVRFENTTRQAHRVAYVLLVGPIPKGMRVLHHCDNRACIEETHLFLGTQHDNVRDMWAKGRGPSGERNGSRTHPESRARGERHGSRTCPERVPRGERKPLAKFTEADVVAIRRRHAEDGLSHAALAREYGVDPSSICRIIHRLAWAHVV